MSTHENGNGNGSSSGHSGARDNDPRSALFKAGQNQRGSGGSMYALFAPPAVDAVALEERASSLGKRSIKKATKVAGLKLAVSMMDLTTLEGKDTAGKVRQLCQKALAPLPGDPSVGPCGAICVYPNHVTTAKEVLAGSPVHIASVATCTLPPG